MCALGNKLAIYSFNLSLQRRRKTLYLPTQWIVAIYINNFLNANINNSWLALVGRGEQSHHRAEQQQQNRVILCHSVIGGIFMDCGVNVAQSRYDQMRQECDIKGQISEPRSSFHTRVKNV